MATKNIKGRRKIIRDPITEFTFYLQCGGTEYEAYRWAAHLLGTATPQNLNKYISRNHGSCGTNSFFPYSMVIWLEEKCGGSTIAHEVAHAVTNVCRVLEMNPVDSDEFYSSYLGWLFKQVNMFFQGK